MTSLPGTLESPRRAGSVSDETIGPPEEGVLFEVARRVHELSIEEWGARRAVSMVGGSAAMSDLFRKIEKVAPFDEPVLVTGESGVGKEAVAQAVYLLGSRRGKPFVSVNSPQFQEGNLTVSELFGHVKGSFTGAVADHKGHFESANGGVIFLDEIGDLPATVQVLLLRALASGEFRPLGSMQTRMVNVRVIAATNRPVEQMAATEEFRRDLFFRLRYFLLKVPALRDRGDDWRMLLDHYLRRLADQYGVVKSFSRESIQLLERYDWPGNVRELLGIVTQGYAMSDGTSIEPKDFAALLSRRSSSASHEEDLYRRIIADSRGFWEVAYKPFMERDLNRAQVRGVIAKGLLEARGSYRRLMELFRVPQDDYQKFMDFLRHHRLKT